jgi:hypothetical protein
VALVLAVMTGFGAAGCGGRLFGKVYEYEEDLYLSLDGTADLIVNASVAALVALRGIDLDTNPAALPDRNRIRAIYESPGVEVARVSRPWKRHGRRYLQVRLRIDDIRKLSAAPPFAWSTYELVQQGGEYVFRQTVGASALRPGTLKNVGWTGGELVAFRLHLPSKILYHNARDLQTNESSGVQRGNILAWEQPLADRLDGRPVVVEVRMEGQSILYRTLWLFAGAFTSAVLLLGLVVWLTVRKGAKDAAAAS